MTAPPRAGLGGIARLALAISILSALCLTAGSGYAAIRHHRSGGGGEYLTPTDPDKDAALIVDGATGKSLYERNADVERHPASLTKMMTLYLLFEQLKSGHMTLSTDIPISEHASSQRPTKLHLRPGTSIPVDTAIKAVVVWSANDVAVAIAEAIGGTEEHFAELMTAKARQLGMEHTFYHNASGLPDEAQITTARDLALLAHHLAYDFPQYFPYFATPAFTYRGGYYVTHDNLIGKYDGADGIKTGYTEASGFNLVSSVVRGGAHIIGVVMGGRSAHRRDREMIRLLDDAFARVDADPHLVARANVPWQVIADNTRAAPAIAGFQIGAAALPPGTHAVPSDDPNDENAAESRPDTDENEVAQAAPGNAAAPASTPAPGSTNVIAEALPPAPNLSAALPAVPAVPPPERMASLVVRPAPPAPPPPAPRAAPSRAVMLASYESQSHPLVTPKSRAEALGEGDIGDVIDHVARAPAKLAALTPASQSPAASALNVHDWAIQIGAFADVASAKAQLQAYVERSMDILGQAKQIVAPFQGTSGQTLYRARFGPFVETEARQVCERLTERGQTCFAAVNQK